MGKNYQKQAGIKVKLTYSKATQYNIGELCSTSPRGHRLIRTSRRGGPTACILSFDADKSALPGVFVRDSAKNFELVAAGISL